MLVAINRWEFYVQQANEKGFEEVNGPEGDWARFFSGSPDFMGTDFSKGLDLRDGDQARRYLTADRWRSEAAFERRIAEDAREFGRLSRLNEALSSEKSYLGFHNLHVHRGSFPTALMVDYRFAGVYDIEFTWKGEGHDTYGEDYRGEELEPFELAEQDIDRYVSTGRALDDGIPKLLARHACRLPDEGVVHLADFQVVRAHKSINIEMPLVEPEDGEPYYDDEAKIYTGSVEIKMTAVGYQER